MPEENLEDLAIYSEHISPISAENRRARFESKDPKNSPYYL